MEKLMKIFCGTLSPKAIEIDLCNYGEPTSTNASDEEQRDAFELLYNTMNDTSFAGDHCRNRSAVNSCIALHVLGFNPVKWFDNFFADQNIYKMFFYVDIARFMDHVHRVCGHGSGHYVNYLLRWGPKGNEGEAFRYAID